MTSRLILNSSSISMSNSSIRMINVPRISNTTLSKPARRCLYSKCLSLIFLFLTEFFSPVFVCFLKRSHILTRGQTEGLSKWRESTNAKMIRKSSLQRLDVAASLCRSVPSQCTGGALQSCSLCWLRQCSEAEEPGAPTRSLPCSCAQTVPSQTVTPAHCVL